jgi:quercetin dioxygenase-like cupin family protein
MYITSQRTPVPAGPGSAESDRARQYHLVSADICGSDNGEVGLLELPAGATHDVATGNRESGSILLDGGGQLLTGNTTEAIQAGTILYCSAGRSFTVRTTDQASTLLTITGAASTPPCANGEHVPPADTETAHIQVSSVSETVDMPVHDPERGFYHMSARMLIDLANGGSQTFTLAQSTFAPGQGCHALHRHSNAAEVFYVWSGQGVHLTEDGTEHRLCAGDLAYVPRNEWHGFRNTGRSPVRALFAYLGANSRESAGYELAIAP